MKCDRCGKDMMNMGSTKRYIYWECPEGHVKAEPKPEEPDEVPCKKV